MALTFDPEDVTWKQALYKLIDKLGEAKGNKAAVLTEIKGLSFSGAIGGNSAGISGEWHILTYHR